ncbi:hypothetical protein ACFL09_03880, partial [Planctomycetota bacterium]
QEILAELAASRAIIVDDGLGLHVYEPTDRLDGRRKQTIDALVREGILTAHTVSRNRRTHPDQAERWGSLRGGIRKLWSLSLDGWREAAPR